MPELVLYKAEWCPYCQRVQRFIETSWKHDASNIALRDIDSDDGAKGELERAGGKVQVPCHFIYGKPLYESSDIIDYLSTL
jgi:glutaredoxin 3